MQQGLLLRPIGNTVYFMPPYTINEAEIEFMVGQTNPVIQSIL
jgi:adenosylmethionine-8-amino-7-oxononanoate aminotransferase